MSAYRKIRNLIIVSALVSVGVIAEHRYGIYDKIKPYIAAISCQIENMQRFAEEKGLLSKLN